MDESEPGSRALVPAPTRTPSQLGGLAARTLKALRATGADVDGSWPPTQIDLSSALVYRVARAGTGEQGRREGLKVVEWLVAADPDLQAVLDMSRAIYGSPGSLRQLFRFLDEPEVRAKPFLFYISETDLRGFSLSLGEGRHSALAVVGPPLFEPIDDTDNPISEDWTFPQMTEQEVEGLGLCRVEPVGLGSASLIAALDEPRIPSGVEPAGQWLVLAWLVSCIARECWFEPADLPPEPFEPRLHRHGPGGRLPPTPAEREAWRQRHDQWEREHAAWEQTVREQIVCPVEPAPAAALPPPPDAGTHFFPSGGQSSACRRYASPEKDHVDASGHHWRFVPMSTPHAVCRDCETEIGLRPREDSFLQDLRAAEPARDVDAMRPGLGVPKGSDRLPSDQNDRKAS